MISGNNFINNSAQEGGALTYLNKKPQFSNNIFQNNSAIYGNDISSFPVRIKLFKDRNIQQTITFLSHIRPSKDDFFIDNFIIVYLDNENQTVIRNLSEGYILF